MKIKEKSKKQGFPDACLRGEVREVGRSTVPLVATRSHSAEGCNPVGAMEWRLLLHLIRFNLCALGHGQDCLLPFEAPSLSPARRLLWQWGADSPCRWNWC